MKNKEIESEYPIIGNNGIFDERFIKIRMNKFNEDEFDFLMLILYRLKKENTYRARFSFDELKWICGGQDTNLKEFSDKVYELSDKIMGIIFSYGNDESYTVFVLFTCFEFDGNKKYIEIDINEKFISIIDILLKDSNRKELKEFASLNSYYSKECYKKLKQNNGIWKVSINEFKEIFDISIDKKMTVIEKDIIGPMVDDLSNVFKGFGFKKILSDSNNEIEGFLFHSVEI